MSPLDVGDLDREITLQTASVTQNATTGASGPDWNAATEETIWAQWLPGTTRESFVAQRQIGAYIDGIYRVHDLETRPNPETTRIVGHDGRTYDLKGVIEDGLFDGLQLVVVARGEAA